VSLKGKYDFPGIRKAGGAALKVALASTGWGAKLLASPLKVLVDPAVGFLSEWLANKGLLVINLGVIYVDGKLDQKAFDAAMEDAITKAQVPGLTVDEQKEIDYAVIRAFRKFGKLAIK
jgi:hypothetical protein